MSDEQLSLGVAQIPGGARVRLFRDGARNGGRSLLRYVDLIVFTCDGMDIEIDAHEVATMGSWSARAVLDLWRALEELGYAVQVNFGRVIPLP